MASNLSIPGLDESPNPVSFEVLSSVPALADSISRRIESYGFRRDPESAIKLVVDVKPGYALCLLESLVASKRSELRLVVVTFSLCAEYWDDLWDLHPDILVVDGSHEHDFAAALARAAEGEQYRVIPRSSSPLTAAERMILRGAARGWTNTQIAKQLGIQVKTVANTLTTIYKKIGVENRTEATLYYWDLWRDSASNSKPLHAGLI